MGTRPEAIKLAPVIKVFQSCDLIETRIVLTGQHYEMINQVMEIFKIKANKNLNLMKNKQTLAHITSASLDGLSKEFKKFPPSIVLVQGDTSTSFSGALAAFYSKIPVAHVEAGLRTDSLYNPFPEEANRRFISQIAALNFAPTDLAESNLKREGVFGEIFNTGNTVIDSLLSVEKYCNAPNLENLDFKTTKLVLVTIHRRENWGDNIKNIANAIKKLSNDFEDLIFLLPMHKNLIVRRKLKSNLKNCSRVFLSEPLDYLNLVSVMKSSYIVLTDSGGIQEEAPTFGKPVFILRDTTERPEGVNAGISFLIGTKTEDIVREVSKVIENKKLYESIAKTNNPYGDGNSSLKILKICLKYLFK